MCSKCSHIIAICAKVIFIFCSRLLIYGISVESKCKYILLIHSFRSYSIVYKMIFSIKYGSYMLCISYTYHRVENILIEEIISYINIIKQYRTIYYCSQFSCAIKHFIKSTKCVTISYIYTIKYLIILCMIESICCCRRKFLDNIIIQITCISCSYSCSLTIYYIYII